MAGIVHRRRQMQGRDQRQREPDRHARNSAPEEVEARHRGTRHPVESVQPPQLGMAHEIGAGRGHLGIGEMIVGETPDPAREPAVVGRVRIAFSVGEAVVDAMLARKADRIGEGETAPHREHQLSGAAGAERMMREVAMQSARDEERDDQVRDDEGPPVGRGGAGEDGGEWEQMEREQKHDHPGSLPPGLHRDRRTRRERHQASAGTAGVRRDLRRSSAIVGFNVPSANVTMVGRNQPAYCGATGCRGV